LTLKVEKPKLLAQPNKKKNLARYTNTGYEIRNRETKIYHDISGITLDQKKLADTYSKSKV